MGLGTPTVANALRRLSVSALVACLALAAAPSNARAQGAVCTIDLLDNNYDVFVVGGGAIATTMNAFSNVEVTQDGFGVNRIAVSVGSDASNRAVLFCPECGLSDYFMAPDIQPGGFAAAYGINDDFRVVGSLRESGSVPSRAFLYTRTEFFRFLDDVYPSLRTLVGDGDSTAWAIDASGRIVVTVQATSQTYLLASGGSLSPIPDSALDCVDFGGGMLNSRGQLIPSGVGSDDDCAVIHTALNDLGTVVGYEVGDDASANVALRDGIPLPGGLGARPTDINKDGYVGAYPGVIWTPAADKIDLGPELKAQCNLSNVTRYLLADGTLPQSTYINDELHIATDTLFLRPAEPDILYATNGSGFEFFNDGTPEGTGIGVRVGNRFIVDVYLQNIGRNSFHNIVVESTQDPSLFRLISGPTPPLPAALENGPETSYSYEFEAVGPGVLNSVVTIRGTDPSGVPYAFPQAERRFVFVAESPLNATIKAEPGEVQIGDTFTVTLTAKNISSVAALDDVGPLGPLEFLGEADATITSGPTPPTVATLAPGAIQTFVYQLEATAGGSMTIHGTLGATTELGDDVSAEAQCSVGEDSLRASDDAEAEAGAPAVCPIDGGAAVEIALCKATLVLESETIRYADLAGDSEPAPDTGYKKGMT